MPKGKVAKLCRTRTTDIKKFSIKEILKTFGIIEARPCIVITGSRPGDRLKFYAGIARAAFKTGAMILDSGTQTGIETFTMRNGKLILFFVNYFFRC